MKKNTFWGQRKIKLNFGIMATFLCNPILMTNLGKYKGKSLFSPGEAIWERWFFLKPGDQSWRESMEKPNQFFWLGCLTAQGLQPWLLQLIYNITLVTSKQPSKRASNSFTAPVGIKWIKTELCSSGANKLKGNDYYMIHEQITNKPNIFACELSNQVHSLTSNPFYF